jgi:hypothetical protein
MQSNARVTIVTVTYGSAVEIGPFLAQIPAGMPLVVVDNAGGDDTPARAKAARPESSSHERSGMLGFPASVRPKAHLITMLIRLASTWKPASIR